MKSDRTQRYQAKNWRLSRRSVLASAAAGGSAAMLAACGKKNGTKPAASNSAGTPTTGGQVSLSTPTDPFDLDPTSGEQNSRQILPMVYDSLLAVKTGPDVKYNDLVLQAGLADKWETSDGQNFTFHLHPGAAFANLAPVNGRAVTSADVKWSLEYVARIGDFKNNKALKPALYSEMFAGMSSIDTPDANTVVVHFDAPYVPFLAYTTADWTPVLPHDIYDADGNFSNRAIGSGPWQLDTASSQKGSHWLLKRNPTYFKQVRPYIDSVNWLVLPDSATQSAAFTTHQIETLPGEGGSLNSQTVQQIRKDDPSAVQVSYLNPSSGILYWNTRHPPLSDERIRHAISLCIDRDELIKTLSGEGQGQWSLAACLPGVFTDQEVHQMLPIDPTQAAQLVSAAGYPNGAPVNMTVNTEGGQFGITLTQLVQAQLKRGNINVTIDPATRAVDNQRRHSLNFQLSYTPKNLTLDIDSYLVGEFYSKSAHNYMGINDPALDKLVLAQRSETDPAKRTALIRQAVTYINAHSYALAFYYPTNYMFWWPNLKNFAPNWGANAPQLVNSWLAS